LFGGIFSLFSSEKINGNSSNQQNWHEPIQQQQPIKRRVFHFPRRLYVEHSLSRRINGHVGYFHFYGIGETWFVVDENSLRRNGVFSAVKLRQTVFFDEAVFCAFKSCIRFIGFNHFQRRESLLFGKNHNIGRICGYIYCVKNFLANFDFCGIDGGSYLGKGEKRTKKKEKSCYRPAGFPKPCRSGLLKQGRIPTRS